jgi:hypothetical protein
VVVTDQLSLDLSRREDAIDRDFAAFHAENPHVMTELVRLTREARSRGLRRVGIKMLFEVVRWDHALRTSGAPFRLNNNYTSRYARAIMAAHPDLDGVYEIRELRPPVPRSLAAA